MLLRMFSAIIGASFVGDKANRKTNLQMVHVPT
jgi:hypothetical protein